MIDTSLKYILKIAIIVTLALISLAAIKVIQIANEPEVPHYRF